MKIKKVSLLVLSLLVGLAALHAVPTDPGSSTDPNNPVAPTNPAPPAPPTPPSSQSDGILTLGLSDNGSTHNISASDPFEVQLPSDLTLSWCYVENVALENGFIAISYTPTTYAYTTDPDDTSKVQMGSMATWMFFPLPGAAGTSVTLSFYARDYDGRLFPTPYSQVYNFTINVDQAPSK